MSRLARLLRPQSIAVIGGGLWCENIVKQCRKIGFTGDIWPVHPARKDLLGLKTFNDIDTLPSAPDAAFIGVNRDITIEIVRKLSRRGAGGAVCFASGFQESQAETADGAKKQQKLLDAAGAMTILGPNCYGFLNYLDRVALWPDQHGGVPVDRGVAIITQSSNIAINLTMQARGLPLGYVVTVGNQAQTGLSETALTLLQDPRVTALGLHIEGIDDLQAFEAMAAKARALGKPIVALKVGTSDQAKAATVSHTASLVGTDAGAKALMSRLGIGQAASLTVFLETLKLLHIVGPLSSGRIASMSCSGGEASLIADTAHGSELQFPPLNATQQQKLRSALGPNVALANPLDYHTYIWGNAEAMTATFTAMMQGDLAMGCVVLDFPRADRCNASAWEPVITAISHTIAATQRPMAVLASLPETMPEDIALRLTEMGIVSFSGINDAVQAMEIAAFLGQSSRPQDFVLPPPTSNEGRTLTEAEAKDALSSKGIRVPKAMRATGTEMAARTAALIGFPVVLKGEGIAHKTEAGAVALNLKDTIAVSNAAAGMPTESFLVEEMIAHPIAELLIGVVADAAHGYVLTLSAGGVLAELLDDATSVLVPASREEVANRLQTLRIARILNGYRGGEAANLDAILDAIMAVQAYVIAERPLEIEINPLMCGAKEAIAADALIRIGDINDS